MEETEGVEGGHWHCGSSARVSKVICCALLQLKRTSWPAQQALDDLRKNANGTSVVIRSVSRNATETTAPPIELIAVKAAVCSAARTSMLNSLVVAGLKPPADFDRARRALKRAMEMLVSAIADARSQMPTPICVGAESVPKGSSVIGRAYVESQRQCLLFLPLEIQDPEARHNAGAHEGDDNDKRLEDVEGPTNPISEEELASSDGEGGLNDGGNDCGEGGGNGHRPVTYS